MEPERMCEHRLTLPDMSTVLHVNTNLKSNGTESQRNSELLAAAESPMDQSHQLVDTFFDSTNELGERNSVRNEFE